MNSSSKLLIVLGILLSCSFAYAPVASAAGVGVMASTCKRKGGGAVGRSGTEYFKIFPVSSSTTLVCELRPNGGTVRYLKAVFYDFDVSNITFTLKERSPYTGWTDTLCSHAFSVNGDAVVAQSFDCGTNTFLSAYVYWVEIDFGVSVSSGVQWVTTVGFVP